MAGACAVRLGLVIPSPHVGVVLQGIVAAPPLCVFPVRHFGVGLFRLGAVALEFSPPISEQRGGNVSDGDGFGLWLDGGCVWHGSAN